MTSANLSTHSVSDVIAKWSEQFTEHVGGTKPTADVKMAAPRKATVAKKDTAKAAKKKTPAKKSHDEESEVILSPCLQATCTPTSATRAPSRCSLSC